MQMKLWHWILSHLGVGLIVALAILAWIGFHRPLPTPGSVVHEIQTVVPGETRVVTIQVPGAPFSVPEVVFAPEPTVRVITVEKPIIVPGPEKTKIIQSSPETVAVHINRICVHPDNQAPDPTCGGPIYPNITLVRSGDGFKPIQDPTESANTQLGPTVTTVKVASEPSKWTYRIGAGYACLPQCQNVAIGQVQYRLTGPLFVQGQFAYGLGIGGMGVQIMAGIEF